MRWNQEMLDFQGFPYMLPLVVLSSYFEFGKNS